MDGLLGVMVAGCLVERWSVLWVLIFVVLPMLVTFLLGVLLASRRA